MTPIEQQMIDELIITQGLTNNLAANLNSKGVPSNTNEGLDTLVPKVLQIDSGATKTPYEEWQEGFGANWDSVIQNAPMTNTQRFLHIYTKVELLKMGSTFLTATEIYTYNGSVYRQITMDSDKRLAFINEDYITNTFDNLQYVCVVYGNTSLNSAPFNEWLPIVYSNSKFFADDKAFNLANGVRCDTLRGIDVNVLPPTVAIYGGLEHLTYQSAIPSIVFSYEGLRNCEIRLLKEVFDTLPTNGNYIAGNDFTKVNVKITDEALADWFYNTWLYYDSGTRFGYPVGNYVRKFKVNSAMLLKASGANSPYINKIPNCDYLEGTFTEDQASEFPGLHFFSSDNMRNLKNFPMWTVIGGASTGCLLPASSASPYANFRFYSMQLERSNFALFNNGVIDTDPTKSFVANLPTVLAGSAQTIYFDDKTFKNQFTAGEQAQIVSTITGKNWGLTW